MKKNLCVFCGARSGHDSAYIEAAQQFGASLAKRDIRIIYGGASIGIMGAVANACLENSGEVVGVIPQSIVDLEVAHKGLSKLYVVESMHERKQKMHELSDGFVCLPGGLGTLDEFFETATWRQLGYHQKPTAFLNTNDFFSPLFDYLKQAEKKGFIVEKDLSDLIVEQSCQELINKILTRIE